MEEPTESSDGLSMECERKKGVKSDTVFFRFHCKAVQAPGTASTVLPAPLPSLLERSCLENGFQLNTF